MARISDSEQTRLYEAIRSHDYLAALVNEIEGLHRLVFHANIDADWSQVRASAEQIVMAELATRYAADIRKLHGAIEDLERRGRERSLALRELASRIHSYYTTPLGVLLRRELFGDQAVFLSAVDAERFLAAASKP
ncbi:MAG: hypothetical protein SF069_16240 [Phycisphaerae bacterium]|nr:hypothetical protein [Phycisphaerae bacterium]